MDEFFKFLRGFFYKRVTQFRDASIRLGERSPNLFLGLCGLGVLILPTTIHILIARNLILLMHVILFFGGDGSFVTMILTNVFSSFACSWILFATKVSGALIVLLAVTRSVLQKRPKNGYMPLFNSSKPNQNNIVEIPSDDGA